MRDAHTPRKRGPATEEGKVKSLANLIQNKEAVQLEEIKTGTRKRVQLNHDRHGAYSNGLDNEGSVKQIKQQIMAVMNGNTGAYLTPADEVSINLLASCLKKLKQTETHIDKSGLTTTRGQIRPVTELYIKLLREARELANVLGLNPLSRAKIGLDAAGILGHVGRADQQAVEALAANPELADMAVELFRRTHPGPQK